ncbi:MAG: EAL domain-containing protein [Demequinaceae bacterium]|nr:EAL domain-containing protein [Demequinaceae bacterium]
MGGLTGVIDTPAFLIVASILLLLMAVIGLVSVSGATKARAAKAEAVAREGAVREQMTGLFEMLREGVVVTAPTGEILMMSDSAASILAVEKDDVLGRPIARLPLRVINPLMHPVNLQEVFSARYGDSDEARIIGVPGRRGADDVRWIQVTPREIGKQIGDPVNVSILVDSTGTKEASDASHRTDALFRRAVESAPIGLALVDLEWRLMEVNRTFAAILGTTVASLRGAPLASISHREDVGKEGPQTQDLYDGKISRFSVEKRFVKADGGTVWAVLDVGLVRHPGGAPDHYIVHLRETNEERIRKENLEHRAERDPLTQLANRTLFYEELRKAIASPSAVGKVAVLAVDLDGFKGLNDRFGHAMGDLALLHLAGVLRQSVGSKGTVARLGGDEFAIILLGPSVGRSGFDTATVIHEKLREPVQIKRHRIILHASIGIAVADVDTLANGEMGLVEAADAAMYRAKGAGKSRTELFVPSMRSGDDAHGALNAELARAVEAGDLVLHYQPILELESRTVVGYEALVRWQHPTRGVLLPGTFLPAMDDRALSIALGSLLVDQAAAFLAANKEAPIWVSLNVSADQLGDSAFADRVLTSIARHHLSPQRIVVELTEASLVSPNTRIRHELTELRNAGVPILLDDFGTGVSPLSYLRDLPVSGVKLDMSFTAGIPEDPAGARVSRALGALARELGLATIAEGIETESQAEFLMSCGWRYGQGWLFGVAQPGHCVRDPSITYTESYIEPQPNLDEEG